MALPTLVALFFSFAFAVASIGLHIHALADSNGQVDRLRSLVPRGTVLDVNRNGGVILSVYYLRFSCVSP